MTRLLLSVLLVGCLKPDPPKPLPEPDVVVVPPDEVPPDDGQHVEGDGLGTPLGDVCRRLRELGCPEGARDSRTRRTCYQTYVHATTALRVEAPVACLLEAESVEAVRVCGTPNTIRVSCKR